MLYQAQAKRPGCWKMFGKKRRRREEAWEDAKDMAQTTNATAVIVAHLKKGKMHWYDVIKLANK